MTAKTSQAYTQRMGGNEDGYSGQGRIWEIAARHNKQSIVINGNVTSVRRRVVSKDKYEAVGLK